MEQAISWKGISELRKMKNSIDLLHNCDDDDGWLHWKKIKCNINIDGDKTSKIHPNFHNKHKKSVNYDEDADFNDNENNDKEDDNETSVCKDNIKVKEYGSVADTDGNSTINTGKFHITSKRSYRKKCNSADLKNVNNLPTKNLKEKMKKMITNNIK